MTIEQTNYIYHSCKYEDCTEAGSPYTYPEYHDKDDPNFITDPDEGSTHYYCNEHAGVVGFCIGCAVFWGGVELFEFSIRGKTALKLCDDCWDEFKTELDPDDEDDYEEYSKQEEIRQGYEDERQYVEIFGD